MQAAGSLSSKETVMQSLKTVTGGIRDLNNVHEITDLLPPNDPGKLYSAIERKAAGWALDSATARLGRERVPKATTKVRTARRFPASIVPKALVLEETSADFRTKGQTNPAARAAKARRRTTKEIDARSCDDTCAFVIV